MKRLLLLIAFVCPLAKAQYVDGTPLYLDPGQNLVTVTDGGTVGGTSSLILDTTTAAACMTRLSVSSCQNVVWFSMPGFPQKVGSQTACHATCGVTLNQEYGQYKYWSQVCTSSGGVPTGTCTAISAKSYLAFVQQPCAGSTLGTYQVPIPVMGFENFSCSIQFAVAGGTNVSSLRVLIHTSNLRNGQAWLQLNGGVKHYLKTIPTIGMTSTGSACTLTTPYPHGISSGATIQLNGTINGGFLSQGTVYADKNDNDASYMLTGYQTVSSATSNTLTFPCTSPSGTLAPAGFNQGLTVSATTYLVDESRWFGGLNNNREAIWVAVPLGSTEVTAGATNTIVFGFSGDPQAVVHGWRVLGWNIVQPDVQMSQIVVSGSTATATTSTTHNFSTGDTLILRDAPGPQWRFDGVHTVASTADTSHFAFLWGSDLPGQTPGTAPYTTAAATYTVPVVNSTFSGWVSPPAMYVSRGIIPYADFVYENPASYNYGSGNTTNGLSDFNTATLRDRNPWTPNNASLVHCNSCHAPAVGTVQAGWDLLYFGFEPQAITVAALGRGLTQTQAADILAYIGSINTVSPPAQGFGPWDPVNQPCPGLDAGTTANWAHGCGLNWKLSYPSDTAEWLVPSGSFSSWVAGSNVNQRELPTALQMPHWMKLLPGTHPIDFFHDSLNIDFTTLAPWTSYQGYLSSQVQGDFTTYQSNSWFGGPGAYVIGPGAGTLPPTASIESGPGATGANSGYQYPSQYGEMDYNVAQWANSQEFDLCFGAGVQNLLISATNAFTGTTPNARAAAQYNRGCFDHIPFNTGPHRAIGGAQYLFLNTDNALNGINWNHETVVDYHWALILNGGNKLAEGGEPIDWPYQAAFYANNAKYRPDLYLTQLAGIKQEQEFWGWTNPITSIGPGLGLRFELFVPGGEDVPVATLSTNTELANVATGMAQVAETAVGISGPTTAQWQAAIATYGCGTAAIYPNAKDGFLGDGCSIHELAFALAYWGMQGVSTTVTNPIVTWANLVNAGTGHDFSTDQIATCTYGPGPSFFLACTNYPFNTTFTNGTVAFSATNTLASGQTVQMMNILPSTGNSCSPPSGFSTGTIYYVISAGLSSSAFELSATLGGSAITPGSSGSCGVNPG